MLEFPRLSSWPSFLVCLPLVSPSLKASNAIHMSVDSQFISPAWTGEMLVFHSREVYPTAYMTFPLGCCINQQRLGYALLMMTSSLSGVSQKSLFFTHATYPPRSALCHLHSRIQADGAAPIWNIADHSVRENRKHGKP